jgi:hypothetical protein
MKPLRKWNGKTQSFDEVSYEGYKANRAAMPEDMRRQIPYIRGARLTVHRGQPYCADAGAGAGAGTAAGACRSAGRNAPACSS